MFAVFPDEETMRAELPNTVQRSGVRYNLQWGVIGEFGGGAVMVFKKGSDNEQL
jgi:hypothetical protein